MSSSLVPPDFDIMNSYNTDIGDEDNNELYLIRVPKGTDMKKLNGKTFSHSRVKQYEVQDGPGDLTTVYELASFEDQSFDAIPLVSANGNIKVGGPLSGLFSVTKSYKTKDTVPSQPPSRLMPSGPVPMPEGLRVRFTPFGAGQPVQMPQRHKSIEKLEKRVSKRRKMSSCAELDQSQNGDISMSCLQSESDGGKRRKDIKLKKKFGHERDESTRKKRKSDINFESNGSPVDDLFHTDGTENNLLNKSEQDYQEAAQLNGWLISKINSLNKKSSLSAYSTTDSSLNVTELVEKGSAKKKKQKKGGKHQH